jgi:MFS family permease
LTLGTDLPAATARPANAWGAFRSPNYRLYLFGLVVSQTGTWMQYVAEGLLVYRLTHAPLSLGLVGFLPMLPLVPLMLVSGALADRLPRRKLLVLVQFGSVLPPLGLAALTWSGVVQVWHVILVEVLMQAMAAVDLPARQALIADTVDPAHLDTAVAVSASAFNLARVVGPALGGLLVAWAGEAVCFALNGLSFLFVAAALLLMHVPPHKMSARQQSLGTNVVDGIRYILKERLLLATLAVSVAVGLLVMPYQRFLPVFALDILNVGDWGLGMLNAAAGLGAVVGAVVLAWLLSTWPGRRGRWILVLSLVLPFALAGFSQARTFWLSVGLVTLVGAGVVAVRSLAFTLAQVTIRDDLRGRVMGMLTLASVSSIRVGELGIGILAERTGQISPPLLFMAVLFLLSVVAAGVLVPSLRRAA